jgi:hypothetical protein
MNYFYDKQTLDLANVTPSILAVGDSWFWYPIPEIGTAGANLVSNLGPIVGTKNHNILAVGANGAEAVDFTNGSWKQRAFHEAIRLYGRGLSAVFISAGGNDFAGFDDFRPILNDDCSKAKDAASCFRTSGNQTKEKLMQVVLTAYEEIIGYMYTKTPENFHVVMHCYDYVIPSGKGLLGGPGWLKPALDDAKVPTKLQQACINLLIDSHAKLLNKIARSDPKYLHVVDGRGLVGEKEWQNEIHPKPAGFRRHALQAWKPVLQGINLAT